MGLHLGDGQVADQPWWSGASRRPTDPRGRTNRRDRHRPGTPCAGQAEDSIGEGLSGQAPVQLGAIAIMSPVRPGLRRPRPAFHAEGTDGRLLQTDVAQPHSPGSAPVRAPCRPGLNREVPKPGPRGPAPSTSVSETPGPNAQINVGATHKPPPCGEASAGSPEGKRRRLTPIIHVVSRDGAPTLRNNVQKSFCSPFLWITLWIQSPGRAAGPSNMTIWLDWSGSDQRALPRQFREIRNIRNY